ALADERVDDGAALVLQRGVPGTGRDGRDVHLDPGGAQALEDLPVAREDRLVGAAVREVVGAVVEDHAGDAVDGEDVALQARDAVQAAPAAHGRARGAADALVDDRDLLRRGQLGDDAARELVGPAPVLPERVAAGAAVHAA